jgi:processive 1,2-diacylglycerol beta-glucosyltransferase
MPSLKNPRALFLYSPVGGGHLSAARAVQAAFGARHPRWGLEELNYLAYMPAWERRLWTGLYHATLAHWPSLWRWYRRWTDRPTEPRFLRDRVSDLGARAFAEVLRHQRPRLVVSTSGGAAALAGAAREQLGCAFLNVLVVTGFRGHQHWARPQADLIFVAAEETRADLVARRIPHERILVVGNTPIRPGLRPPSPAEKAQLRTQLGLGSQPVVVVSSGATGAYRAHQAVVRALCRSGRPMEVVTFKGAPAPAEQHGPVRLRRLGFRSDFCDWLSVADVVVGKFGGPTSAEACALAVPLVVYQPIPGPEEANAEYLVSHGAAVWPRDVPALQRAVAALLDAPPRRQAMAEAARRLGRPDAAAQVVEALSQALEARA